ncbi:hypothetical protein K438DRAFT_470138 [Mycena galopus ATCC 62051]|nr:hypothetical protein K438DRAFT_470138 [Mycena galopus ATCC 62051]
MFASLLTLALVCASTLTAVVAEDFTVDTPTLTQCESTTIAWQAGQGDVNLIAVDPSDPCGEVLHDFGDFNSTTTSVKWVVPFPAGTKLQLSAENAAGDEAWSGSMTVGNSSTTSCLPVASASASASVHATSRSHHPPRHCRCSRCCRYWRLLFL